MKRICIYPADVRMITGRSETYSRKLLRKIKIELHKQPGQLVSLQEFCDYTGLSSKEVEEILKWSGWFLQQHVSSAKAYKNLNEKCKCHFESNCEFCGFFPSAKRFLAPLEMTKSKYKVKWPTERFTRFWSERIVKFYAVWASRFN